MKTDFIPNTTFSCPYCGTILVLTKKEEFGSQIILVHPMNSCIGELDGKEFFPAKVSLESCR